MKKTLAAFMLATFLFAPLLSPAAIGEDDNKEIGTAINSYYKIQKYSPHSIEVIAIQTSQETTQAIVDIKYRKRLTLQKSADGWFVRTKTKVKRTDLTLMDFQIELLPIDNDKNRFSQQADLTLFLKNTSANTISAWRGMLIANNSFGEALFKTKLTDVATNIEPGETTAITFSFTNNRFINNEPYDYLNSYSKENIRLKLTGLEITTRQLRP
ncbi:hypothetical protein A2291_03140 [candidate division WOR-1 bacterium RIFOXYB2_FULL_42_35]|uniref:Uncharacterized protein n=1 Tax=candidate division WOR-1 bacterium RIFOXYC2_FULL_41_25 TaxID=1802586 RepID=A0A1F4TIN2_UNCSA|nr:MAG: hypothetical protein A2247_02215 [candidate division WOR-1 bacterium RIFOXYA2_FULL_41_14]OGC21556.1 MAG: hypothetical protein A2291_03140 [candidate division WOR-1 bacterium RIFOXYB2_FULL_42_35]OGC32534.1 MAG: hypothetical protein A2462_02850 [candidate division WOR-1 bacterium RIFOXYC2_FULL_41_25]